jgi:hypothetical protein
MARSGQESLAQGLPWVAKIMFFALKGLEKWKRARGPVGGDSRLRLEPFQGQFGLGGITQGKPWAKLSRPLRAAKSALD